ncbi:MAG: hypothetical protein MK212_11915 [Saprospiraceae bacterium]|nr:hypothetical protein [Saprospiraceae bacterium]
MNDLFQPLTDSVEELTNDGIPIRIEIPISTSLLIALALVIPILVWFAMKRISNK